MRHSLIGTKLTNSAETRYKIHDFVIIYLIIFPFPPNNDTSKEGSAKEKLSRKTIVTIKGRRSEGFVSLYTGPFNP
jgi:hypothetical protein